MEGWEDGRMGGWVGKCLSVLPPCSGVIVIHY
jgi:hypothetical protein